MIQLNEDEKHFLRALVDLSQRTRDVMFGNLVDGLLRDIDIVLDNEAQTGEFRFDHQVYLNNPQLMTIVRARVWLFVRFVKLLNYLESQNYLYLFQEAQLQNQYRFGQLAVDNDFINVQINDEEAVGLLNRISQRTIVIGQTLIDYVNHNFKTEEQLRHIQNYNLSRFAIWVAVILGVVGSVGSAFEVYYAREGLIKGDTNSNDVLLSPREEKFFERLEIELSNIHKLNSRNDTINVRIISSPGKKGK